MVVLVLVTAVAHQIAIQVAEVGSPLPQVAQVDAERTVCLDAMVVAVCAVVDVVQDVKEVVAAIV